MRRLLPFLVLLWGSLAYGQATQVVTGPNNPPTCNANVGLIFFNNSTLPGTMLFCSAANTWSAIGSGGGGSSSWVTITGGTNNSQTFVCSTGCSFSATGSGVVAATTAPWTALTGMPADCPSGQFVTSILNGTCTGTSSGIPGGVNGDIQMKSGTAFVASHMNDNGTVIKTTEDTEFQGPNPYVDARLYGVRAVSPNIAPATPGITATIGASSASASISSASTFQNGDGVVIWGAGATNTMSTPSAPTVVPSVSAAETGSLLDVNSPTGATSYQYQIVARDINGGLTAASTATAISTGQATLGSQSVSLSAISLSNNTLSATTSSAHTLAVGAMVVIEGVTVTGGLNPYNGWYTVASVPNNTHFTCTIMSDTRAGAPSSGSGGNAHWFLSNRITWSTVSGAFQYYIYGRTSGAMALIGVSWPDNTAVAGDQTYLAFDDFGSTLTTAPNLPAYVPTGTPPVAATNDMLITTIASGAGSTTLTLVNAATNAVSGATILFDDGINLKTAANTAANTLSGTLYLPSSGTNSLVINSPQILPNDLAVIQNANVYLNETMTVTGVVWKGLIKPLGEYPSFAFNKTQRITVNKANPGFYDNGAVTGLWFSNTSIEATANNANNLMIIDGLLGIPAAQFENVQFVLNNGGTDYMSTGLVVRPQAHLVGGPTGFFFRNTLFLSSQNGGYTSNTPAAYFDNFGNVHFDHLFLSGKGILHRPSQSGLELFTDFIYCQACYNPMLAITNALGGGNANAIVNIKDVTIDTSNFPLFANIGSGMTADIIVDSANTAQANAVTGTPSIFVTFLNGSVSSPGQNTSSEAQDNESVVDGTFGRTNVGLKQLNADLSIGPGYSLFTNTTLAAAATCNVTSGGSVPVGTISYYYTPVYPNGSEGVPSLACSATTSSGNQTVTGTWTQVTGAVGYNIYRNSFLANIGGCGTPQVTSATFTDTSSFTCGTSNPSAAAGGPAGIQNGLIWEVTNNVVASSGSAPTANPGVNLFDLVADNWLAMNLNSSSNKYFIPGWLSSDTWTPGDCIGQGATAYRIVDKVCGGNSGMTSGQVAIAGSASTITSSKAIQGTDANILSSGTVSGLAAALCTDANGGATTTGCSGGSISGMTTNQVAIAGSASSITSSKALQGTDTNILTSSTIAGGAGNLLCTDTGSGATTSGCTNGISGLTSGQIPVAGSSTTLTSSKALQGTDSAILTAGTVSGTAALLCTDANGGATTSGCPTNNTTVYNTASAATTTNIAATNMVASTGALHSYLFSWTISLTVVGTGCASSTTVNMNAIFTDPNTSTPVTELLGVITIAAGGNGTVGFVAQGNDNILAKSGTAVQYSTSGYTAGTGCSVNPTYQVQPTLVQQW